MKRNRRQALVGVALMLPSLIGVTFMTLCPLAKTILRSFFSGLGWGRFAGFKNFSGLINNEAFRLALRNTGRFYLIALPLIVILPLLMALVFSGDDRIDRVFKGTMYLTILLPTASLMTVISLMFSSGGLLSGAAGLLFGVDADKLYDSDFAFILLVALFVYKYGGFNFLIYKIALARVPREYYEEAMISGAGRFRCAWYITLPSILPVFPVTLMLSLLNSYKIYREAYLIGGNYPDDSIYLVQHFISNNFINMNYGRLCAVTTLIVLAAVGLAAIVFVCLRFAGREKREKE